MPFIGVMDDGSSMIHAYTSQERANIGKDSLDLSDRSRDPTGGNGYALLSMSPESAIRAFAPLATNGVKGIVFDVPSVGAFALLVNLPGMWAHAGGKPIVDIVLPPAPGEVLHLARVVQGVQGAEVQAAKLKLLRRFLHLDRVGLVTQAVGSDLPATLADGDRRFMLVVASPEGAQATKQFIMSKGGAEPGVGSVSIRECVEYLRGLRTSEMGIAHFMIDVGSAFHIESIDELTALWDSSPEIQKRQAAVESRHQQSQKG